MVTIVVLGLCHRNNDLFGKIKSTRRRTTPAIAMPGTETCCCMSRAMIGGKSRGHRITYNILQYREIISIFAK